MGTFKLKSIHGNLWDVKAKVDSKSTDEPLTVSNGRVFIQLDIEQAKRLKKILNERL